MNTVSEIPKENEKIRKTIQRQKRQFMQWIEKIVHTNLANNAPKQNSVLAKRIYILYEGALTECHIHQESWPIEAAKDMCVHLLD